MTATKVVRFLRGDPDAIRSRWEEVPHTGSTDGDQLDDLRRRAAWFAARPVPAGLISPDECWSLYLREELLR